MKFTMEEFSESLKAKLTNGGKKNLSMSDRSFNGKVERIYKRLEKAENNDGFELDNIVSEYFQDFEEDDNNIRNDNSAFVKEWQKKHSDRKITDDKNNNRDNNSDGDESKIDLLLQEIQGLKREREEEKREKEISRKRISLKEILAKKGIENKEWIDAQIELIHIDVETDIENISEKLVNNFNKFNSNTPLVVTPKEVSRKDGGIDANEYADVVSIVKKQSNRE